MWSSKAYPLISLALPWDQLLYGPWKSHRRHLGLKVLLHFIIITMGGRKLRGGYVPIAFNEFTRLLGNPMGGECLDAAKRMGLVRQDHKARPGRRSEGYKLTKAALSWGYTLERMPEPYVGRLKRTFRRVDKAASPIHAKMWETLRKVTVDEGVCRAVVEAAPDRNLASTVYSIYATHLIRQRHWQYCWDKNSGRVYSTVANYPSHLRPMLLIDRQKTGECDIASSQPYFLASLVYQGDCSPEAELYRSLVTSSRFYETLGEWAGPEYVERGRERMKKAFIVEVLFGPNRYREALWKAFASRFPKAAAYIDASRAIEFNDLSFRLQSLEAKIVIETILPILYERGIRALSIHDGILAVGTHLKEVREVMLTELERATGLRPTVRIKG